MLLLMRAPMHGQSADLSANKTQTTKRIQSSNENQIIAHLCVLEKSIYEIDKKVSVSIEFSP